MARGTTNPRATSRDAGRAAQGRQTSTPEQLPGYTPPALMGNGYRANAMPYPIAYDAARNGIPNERFRQQIEHMAALAQVPLFPTSSQQFPTLTDSVLAEEAVIHQAHLRSPRPGPRSLVQGAPMLYRHIRGAALEPTMLDLSGGVFQVTFSISPADFEHIPQTKPPTSLGDSFTRILTDGAVLYRLRCVEMKDESTMKPSAWLTTECVWPSGLFIELNGHDCEPRRKPQHKRNLPIDVSAFVQQNNNTISVAYLHMESTPSLPKLAIAVEIVQTTSGSSMMASMKQRSAAEVLSDIKQSIRRQEKANADDQDMVVLSSGRSISLTDPYSGQMLQTPIRGEGCTHFECFELQTYALQRKREEPGFPCIADEWRCPICRGDARPTVLYHDLFMLEVCQDLKKRELSDTKTIVVEADGSWKPVATDSSSGKQNGKIVEVIELD